METTERFPPALMRRIGGQTIGANGGALAQRVSLRTEPSMISHAR